MDKSYTPTVKAYKNPDFLGSSQARNIRILCEYEETFMRLKANNVKASILFFGSARSKTREDYDAALATLTAELAEAETAEAKAQIESQLDRLKSTEWMIGQMEKITELARLLTQWAVEQGSAFNTDRLYTGVARYNKEHPKSLTCLPSYSIMPADGGKAGGKFGGNNESEPASGPQEHGVDTTDQVLVVCTGGGPGFMEAANKGAALVENGRNMGMGITLPFEDGLNEFVSEELAFEFHYFFTRKFWMVYHCQALVVAPGGFGTLDELFEVLTLKQTGKIQKDLPVVLFGKEFWSTVVNWDALVRYGTIAKRDADALIFCDTPQEAFEAITKELIANSAPTSG